MKSTKPNIFFLKPVNQSNKFNLCNIQSNRLFLDFHFGIFQVSSLSYLIVPIQKAKCQVQKRIKLVNMKLIKLRDVQRHRKDTEFFFFLKYKSKIKVKH